MSASADGYVLRIAANRREVLQESIKQGYGISEAVPKFEHSRSAPVLVLLSFVDDKLTHVADGLKGNGGGTQQNLLRMSNVELLPKPLPFKSLVDAAPSSVRAHLRDRLDQGGLLAPKSLGVTVDALIKLEPKIAQRLARYSERRVSYIGRLSETSKSNLALQKESLNVALRIAKIDPDTVTQWAPPDEEIPRSYLDGIQEVPVREDLMVIADAEVFPGLDIVGRDVQTATKIFSKGSTRLRVTMANRQPLEAQTGADLLYFNETYNSFIMVQYKAMRPEARHGDTRTHVYRPDDQLIEEIRRMDEIRAVIANIKEPDSLAGYRLNSEPFYLKLCPNTNLNLDDKGLFPGMYFPLEYWKILINDPVTAGPRGGRIVCFENVRRKLSNTDFVQLVASGFIGSRLYQSKFIRALVSKVLAQGKSVTLEVHSVGDADSVELPPV